MKKILAILLACTLLLSLTACNLSSLLEDVMENLPIESQTPGQIDFADIFSGNPATDTILGKQDEATKQQIIAEAKKEGLDVTFGIDGSTTIYDPETGDTMIQKPDGNWVIKGADGTESQVGGDWPDNEFTKRLPKPDFKLTAVTTDDTSFTAAFLGVKVEDVKAYAAKVKAAGFNKDEEVVDESAMGMTIYTFTAYNSDGWCVSVSYAVGTSGIVLEKP